MIRRAAGLLVALLAAGCVAGPAATSIPPASPTASASATSGPGASPTSALPSPTPPGCVPFDPSRHSEPAVLLTPVINPERTGAYGLNGSGQVGSEVFAAGDWHQPPPGAALSIPRSAAVVLSASLDETGIEPTCLGTIQLAYAPFSPVAAIPGEDTLGELSAKPGSEPAASFTFQAPEAAGEWIVRARITFPTQPGPSAIDSFFRLRVDVAAPAVGGSASRPRACGIPGANVPTAFLSVSGGSKVAAQRGTSDWRNVAADGPPPPGSDVAAAQGDPLVVSIENGICAGWWSADLSPVPSLEVVGREPFLDLVPGYAMGEAVPPMRINQLRLAEIPAGTWWVGVFLAFPDGSGQVIGSTSNFWHVVVR